MVRKRKSPVPVQLLKQVRARERQEMQDRKLARENAERRSLLEDIIDRGFQTFLEVGSALKEIKERKLWSPEYASFEDYCQGRWVGPYATPTMSCAPRVPHRSLDHRSRRTKP
jgi:hypothetical protein